MNNQQQATAQQVVVQFLEVEQRLKACKVRPEQKDVDARKELEEKMITMMQQQNTDNIPLDNGKYICLEQRRGDAKPNKATCFKAFVEFFEKLNNQQRQMPASELGKEFVIYFFSTLEGGGDMTTKIKVKDKPPQREWFDVLG